MNPEIKKEKYEEAKTEIIIFVCEDIIQTSGGSGSNTGGSEGSGGPVVLPGDSFWP